MLNVERWTPLECTQCQPFLHKIRNMSIPTGTSSNATTSKCLHPYRPNLNSPSSLFHAVTVIRFYCLLLCLESRLVPEPGGILRFQSLCRNLAKSHRDFIPNYFWNMSHPISSIERYYCYLHFANQVSLVWRLIVTPIFTSFSCQPETIDSVHWHADWFLDFSQSTQHERSGCMLLSLTTSCIRDRFPSVNCVE